ncbi:hypothetical protein QR685DRAFT_524787 [Neurospora intermedia]|uniref:C2H2-type domain-containing protein n=1 Tax=Neurospora intermedia TaxID=5142 RepID=A0ABR3DES0_NEUIN
MGVSNGILLYLRRLGELLCLGDRVTGPLTALRCCVCRVMYRCVVAPPFFSLGCGGSSVSALVPGGSSRYGVGSNMGMRWGVVRFSDLEYWRCVGAGDGVFEKPKGHRVAAGCWGSWTRRESECIVVTSRIGRGWFVRFSRFLPCCDCDFCDLNRLNEHYFARCHFFTRNRALQSLILLSVPARQCHGPRNYEQLLPSRL